jgi:biopolymer transport protein ExbB
MLPRAAAVALVTQPVVALAQQVQQAAAPPDIARSTAIGPLHDLSAWSMFMSADWLVKAVIVGLILASLATWTILIAKTVQLYRARRELGDNLGRIADSRTLSEAQRALGTADGILAALLAAAVREIHLSADSASEGGIKERAASQFSEIAKLEAKAIRCGMGLVATVGATAPFVGLFGTVWGIMTSFRGIAMAKDTSLAVVAPGIAEALFATAIGLIAAIPATIFYNKFVSDVNKQAQRLEGFADEFAAILSRQIDERG